MTDIENSEATAERTWDINTIRFSDSDFKFDDRDWHDALRRMAQGKPKTYGGVFHDIAQESQRFGTFVTQTPPELTADTTIIAVCGLTEAEAMLDDHDWIFSDFMAFWHLFQGQTNRQFWLHDVDIPKMLKVSRNFVHGNPYQTRKVVLDDQIYAKMQGTRHCPVRKEGHDAKIFRALVATEHKKCQAERRNLLIIMLGHGTVTTNKFAIGGTYLEKSTLVSSLKGVNGKAGKKFRDQETKVDILCSACYSGGWSCYKDLMPLASTATAAGPGNTSLSWPFSGSVKRRAGGSMFTSAILKSLSLDNVTGNPITEEDDDERTDLQERSYSEWARTVFQEWMNIDRIGYVHEFKFSAQNEQWGKGWRDRTGIPVADYQDIWNKLEDWPVSANVHPGDEMNRDPYVPNDVRNEYAEFKRRAVAAGIRVGTKPTASKAEKRIIRKTSALFGGTVRGLEQKVFKMGEEYFASDPGDDYASPNMFHVLLRDAMVGRYPYDEERLEYWYHILDYRLGLMIKVDEHVEILGLPKPDGKTCAEWPVAYSKEGKRLSERYRDAIYYDGRQVVLPPPFDPKLQGYDFTKPLDYLSTSLCLSGLDEAMIRNALEWLARRELAKTATHKSELKNNPNVLAKRRSFYEAFGKGGNMSPEKRRALASPNTSKIGDFFQLR